MSMDLCHFSPVPEIAVYFFWLLWHKGSQENELTLARAEMTTYRVNPNSQQCTKLA